MYDLTPASSIPEFEAVLMHHHIPMNRCPYASLDEICHKLARHDVRISAPHNYYSFASYPRYAQLVKMRAGAYVVNCAEVIASANSEMCFNDLEGGRVYACVDAAPTLLNMQGKPLEVFAEIRRQDEARMRKMYAYAKEDLKKYGIRLDYDEDALEFCQRFGFPEARQDFVIQERQMAQRVVELIRASKHRVDEVIKALTGKDVEEFDLLWAEDCVRAEMLKKEKPWYQPVSPVFLPRVREASDSLGALLMYPRLGDWRENVFTEFEKDDEVFFGWLEKNGFYGIELILSRNSSHETERIVPLARELGYLILPGEEHNTGEERVFVPRTRDTMLSAGTRQALWIDSLVMVAHQELARSGQGWNTTDRSDDARDYFARVGVSILEQTHWEK